MIAKQGGVGELSTWEWKARFLRSEDKVYGREAAPKTEPGFQAQ